MMLLSQAPGGALSARPYIPTSPHHFTLRKPPLFYNTNRSLLSKGRSRRGNTLSRANPDDSSTATTSNSTAKQPFANANPTVPPSSSLSSFDGNNGPVFVGQEDVPLEGVIQFEKPSSSFSRLDKWGRVALLAGGDVLALLLFSAIGRFSHGFSIFDYDTLRTADPFIAGWFCGAYFLGGYGEDGRGINGSSKAIIAAAKSWALGIPLGLIIRAATSGHVPPYTFMSVTMGSTAVLLIGWRALSSRILSANETKKSDVYRRGNPFELFELLTSLVRRW